MKKNILKMRDFILKQKKIVYVFAVAIIIILIWPFNVVSLGYNMVSYNFISGKFEVKDSGIRFTIPFIEKAFIFPVTDQVYTISRDENNWARGIDGSIQIQTKDSQTISIDVSVIYHFEEEEIMNIYAYINNSGINEIEENYIGLFLRNIMSNKATNYTIDEIYSQKRAQFETEVLQELQLQMEPYYIAVSNVLVNNIRISNVYQELLDARINIEKSLIEANSVGEINKILEDTLTDNVLQYKSIQELNDNVKIIIVPSDVSNQLNLGNLYTDTMDNE